MDWDVSENYWRPNEEYRSGFHPFYLDRDKPLLHDIMDTVLRVLNDGTVILSVEYAQTTA